MVKLLKASGPGGDTCSEEEYDDWLQLPLEDNDDGVHALCDDFELSWRKLLNIIGRLRRVEDSKSQLEWWINSQTMKIQLQQQSIEQLQELISNDNADVQPVYEEIPRTRHCEDKLWQLQGVEELLQALKLTEDQVTRLLPTYITTLQNMFPDRIGGDMQTVVIYRLKMMHKSNDSVWLLHDGLDWLLTEVQIMLLLEHTGRITTNQYPVDAQEEGQPLDNFKSRLEVWQQSLHKQQGLHSSLSMMLQNWPPYPWVR